MGGDDPPGLVRQFIAGMFQHLFILLPRTASHNYLPSICKRFKGLISVVGFYYLPDPVKPGITSHSNLRNSDPLQQIQRSLTLYKNMGETIQEFSVPPAIPFEKYLVRSKIS